MSYWNSNLSDPQKSESDLVALLIHAQLFLFCSISNVLVTSGF